MPVRLIFNLIPNLATPRIAGGIRLTDIFDGFLLVQKRKKNIRQKWKELYGDTNWRFGTKLWQPKRNITTCPECGSFHEHHTVCRECFNRIKDVTKSKQEQFTESENTKSWFEPNVTQVKNPASQDSPKVVKDT